jgi:hypothetical protein
MKCDGVGDGFKKSIAPRRLMNILSFFQSAVGASRPAGKTAPKIIMAGLRWQTVAFSSFIQSAPPFSPFPL